MESLDSFLPFFLSSLILKAHFMGTGHSSAQHITISFISLYHYISHVSTGMKLGP